VSKTSPAAPGPIRVLEVNLKNNRCPQCGREIYGSGEPRARRPGGRPFKSVSFPALRENTDRRLGFYGRNKPLEIIRLLCFNTLFYFNRLKTKAMKKATSSTSRFAGVPRVRTGLFGGLLLILLLFRAATLSAQSPIRINFPSDEIGRIPSGWLYWNEKSAAKVYSVQVEGEKRFLHAEARSTMYQLGYEHRWDLQEFP